MKERLVSGRRGAILAGGAMQWTSAITTASRFATAIEEATESIGEQLSGTEPDLVVVFVSAEHREHFVRVHRELSERFPKAQLLGCSAGGVIGGGREIEQSAGLSITAAVMPGVEARPFHIEPENLLSPDAPVEAWHSQLGVKDTEDAAFIVLPDPFSCQVAELVQGLDNAFPGAVKVGGLASGGHQPGQTVLYAGDGAQGTGAVGISLVGNVQVDAIVAQGCRPVGSPMFVTAADHNVINELDGRSPAAALQELYEELTEDDRELMRHSLFLGLSMSDSLERYDRGDFLIRNIVGMDASNGALAVGAEIAKNVVVQFQLRDAKTSADDLNDLLKEYGEKPEHRVAGGLLFSCLGRGKGLYGEPDHDSSAFRKHIGDRPLGGFFCNGEIGPVLGRTYVHGYTSSFGLFRPKQAH